MEEPVQVVLLRGFLWYLLFRELVLFVCVFALVIVLVSERGVNSLCRMAFFPAPSLVVQEDLIDYRFVGIELGFARLLAPVTGRSREFQHLTYRLTVQSCLPMDFAYAALFVFIQPADTVVVLQLHHPFSPR